MSIQTNTHSSILTAIGNTPIVRLNSVSKGFNANVFAKCEFMNPGGSVKDRIGIKMIQAAEDQGLLKPGGTIIEATSGNTGVGLAMAAAVRGYHCIFVMADKQSEEKRTSLRAMGAQVVICPTDVDPEDPRSYYSVAKRLAKDTPNSFYSNQYANPQNPEAHFTSTGPEIWEQCGDELDVFVCSIGTGGTVSGVSRYLKQKNPEIQIIGADPIGSVFFELFHTGTMPKAHSYYVEGIGEDFMPATMNLKSMDDIVQVSDQESFTMARRLIREEGLLVGGSSGSAVVGALKFIQEKLHWAQTRKPNILVLLPDSNSRYLSKFLNDEWLKDAGLLERAPKYQATAKDVLKGKSGTWKSGNIISVEQNDPVGTVVERMRQFGISQIPVCNDGQVVGMLDEVHLLDALLTGQVTMKSAVGPLMRSDNFAFVSPTTSLKDLSALLAKEKTPLVKADNELLGVISKIDLISFLSE